MTYNEFETIVLDNRDDIESVEKISSLQYRKDGYEHIRKTGLIVGVKFKGNSKTYNYMANSYEELLSKLHVSKEYDKEYLNCVRELERVNAILDDFDSYVNSLSPVLRTIVNKDSQVIRQQELLKELSILEDRYSK